MEQKVSQDEKNDIILETGTNEFSVMEFTVDGKCYGINVAKVSIIMKYEDVIDMPNANPYVEGIFKPRDEIITVVDLAKYLNLKPSEDPSRDIIIIAKFNKCTVAFHVHSVEGIRRVSWEDIEKPDNSIYGKETALVTGIARYQERLITIIDFERILYDINPESYIENEEIEIEGTGEPGKPILVVEDSPVLLSLVVANLQNAGYTDVVTKTNGKDAWDLLEFYTKDGDPIEDHIKCVITDIEMPVMDGLAFTKRTKEDSRFVNLPIIMFSSLITDEMKNKCIEVGASSQISKPEIKNLVSLVNKYRLD